MKCDHMIGAERIADADFENSGRRLAGVDVAIASIDRQHEIFATTFLCYSLTAIGFHVFGSTLAIQSHFRRDRTDDEAIALAQPNV